MKIKRLSHIDWEPLLLTILHCSPRGDIRASIERTTKRFMRNRTATGTCACSLKSLTVEQAARSTNVEVTCEWMCEKCLNALCDLLEKTHPDVYCVEVGRELSDGEGHSECVKQAPRLLDIEAARVALDDGNHIDVAPFKIGASAVRVADIREFSAATGYRTRAEVEGDRYTYSNNSCLQPFSAKGKMSQPAVCLCFHDATAFCNWAGFRLPTEAEWLAAVLTQFDELGNPGYELFTADDDSDAPVIRCGMQKGRELCTPEERDLMLSFRVAQSLMEGGD